MNFYETFIRHAPEFISPFRVSDPAYLEPVFRSKVEALMLEASARPIGIKLMIFETYRSQARQSALFAQHATQLQKVGVHGYGLACDVVKDVMGEPSWKGDFTFLVPLAKKYDLISGIDWGHPGRHNTFVDGCHLQCVSIADQERLFSGTWYPDDTYSPYGAVQV